MKPATSPLVNQYYSPNMAIRPQFKTSIIKPSTSNTQRQQRQLHLSTAPSVGGVRSVRTEEEEPQFLYEEAMKQKDLQSLIDSLSRTLSSVSKNEIELNRKSNDLIQKSLEIQQLTKQVERLKQYNNFSRGELLECQKRQLLCQNEVQRLVKEQLTDKKGSEESARKIGQLEKRIEMLLEKNLTAHQDTLKRTLNDLIKDNEQLKRVLIGKNKEIDRLKEFNQKLTNKNMRLTKKLDSLKTRRVSKESRDDQEEDEQNTDLPNGYLFDPSKVPATLDFRISHISTEYSSLKCLKHKLKDILLDIIEHGPDLFSNQVNSLEDAGQRKDLITLVASQFISFKDFAERTNTFFSELVTLLSYDNVEDFQVHVSKAFRSILNAERVHVWVIDEMTGVLTTFDMNRKKKRALLADGAFADVVFNGKTICENESLLLYRTDDECVAASRVLLVPITRPTGLLEVSSATSEYPFDLQYFALLLAKASRQLLMKIENNQLVVRELRYRDLFYESFLQLVSTKTPQEFSDQVQTATNLIFHTSQCMMVFKENETLVKYDSQGKQSYGLNVGLAGMVAGLGRAQIITDIRKNDNFDEGLDIQSILPVFCSPLKWEGVTLGVVEFVLKKKKEIEKLHKFSSGGDKEVLADSVDQDAQRFCSLAETALGLRNRK